MHTTSENGSGKPKPAALSLLASERPRNVSWVQAAGLLFGDWGTSRLYVLGLAFLFAGRTSFWLICLMSLLILAVGWAYSQICRIYPDGGGVYTAAKHKSRTLAVVGALLLFADYTVTASLSVLDAFHYFGLPLQKHAQVAESSAAANTSDTSKVNDARDAIITESDSAHTADLPALPPDVTIPADLKHVKYDADNKQLKVDGTLTADEALELTELSNDSAWQHAVHKLYRESQPEEFLAWDSPGLWAIVAIAVIGLFNLMGPKHTGGFAIFAAVGMVFITLLITCFALLSGKIDWHNIHFGTLHHPPGEMWVAFVSIVLALSGVEAIANLTGVMRKPVAHTARKAIWVVALEVAVFNIILALFMLAIFPLDRQAHVNDMLAFLTHFYVGPWGAWPVRIVGGLLLLSAGNTAITDMISVQYLMARDGELPQVLVKLNRFGVPWLPAIVAASVPILVLLISHDLEALAALYAIGVVGAVAINVTLCSTHPRLRRMHRKVPMVLLGIVLLAIWVTLACTKLHALVFVTVVMIVGLSARAATKHFATRKGAKPSLLRQAIAEQLTAEALMKPKILMATYGSDVLARPALQDCKEKDYTLVVCFIRQVSLSYKYEAKQKLTIDTDLAALRVFAKILDVAHELGVSVIPVYDTGPDAAELLAETAAMLGCEKVLIGTSRQGAIYHLFKGTFQRRLESILPPEIPVQVISPPPPPAPPKPAGESTEPPKDHQEPPQLGPPAEPPKGAEQPQPAPVGHS
jgi:amino acid transporter